MPSEPMNNIKRLKNRVRSIISGSEVPEDPLHAQNTLEWLLKLKPDADETLQIAALGHDIERAMEDHKVRRDDYDDFKDFKAVDLSNRSHQEKGYQETDTGKLISYYYAQYITMEINSHT